MHFLFWDNNTQNPINEIGSVLDLMYKSPEKNAVLNKSENRIEVKLKDFLFTYAFIEEDWILEESEDIAKSFGKNRNDFEIIKNSRMRIEFYGGDDPDLNYFNDYLLQLEKIQKEIPSIIIFDTENGIFFDEQ